MRVLTLSCEYPPVGGGGATACRALAEALARAGHEVDVLTAHMRGLRAEERTGGVRVIRVAGWRRYPHYSTMPEQASFVPAMLRRGYALAREERYDIVHAHFVVPTGAVARLIAQRHGMPYVVTAHGSDVPGYNPDRFALVHRLIAPAWRAVLADAAAVTAPSAFVRELIARRTDVPVRIIPNAFDPALTAPEGLRQRHRVLAVTRLVERKGVGHLLDALAGLGRDIECVIAGDGPLRAALQDRARALGLEARFTGFLDREALPALYASAGIFVLPSVQENFPMVLLEAMSAGCAVVTTAHPGCAELVGDAGLTVPAADSGALREAIASLLADPERAAALGRAGRRRAAAFASSRVSERFAGLFEECRRLRASAGRAASASAAEG